MFFLLPISVSRSLYNVPRAPLLNFRWSEKKKIKYREGDALDFHDFSSHETKLWILVSIPFGYTRVLKYPKVRPLCMMTKIYLDVSSLGYYYQPSPNR